MSTLINQIAFLAIPANGSATLPHGLNIKGSGVVPDTVVVPEGFAFVSADDVDITIANNNPAPADCTIRVEHDHSIVRVYPPGVQNLTPDPFVIQMGSATPGGGSGWTDVAGVVQLVNPADVVVIGAAAPVAGEKLRVVGQARVATDLIFEQGAGGGTHFIAVDPRTVAGPGDSVDASAGDATQGVASGGDFSVDAGLGIGGADNGSVSVGGTKAQRVNIGRGGKDVNILSGTLFIRSGLILLEGSVPAHNFVVTQAGTGINGSQLTFDAGMGGNADGAVDAGDGGTGAFVAGVGGTGSATHAAGDGGGMLVRGGSAGANNGGGPGNGGTGQFGSGNGSAANGASPAGNGGLTTVGGGGGGAGSGAQVGGNGGGLMLSGGPGGGSGGAGAGTAGAIIIGTDNTSAVSIRAITTFVREPGDLPQVQIDENVVVDETGLLLSVAGAAVQRVSVGAANSGGLGFRLVLLPN